MIPRADPRIQKGLPPVDHEPDLEQIRMFVHGVFQRCKTPAWVSLRTFANADATAKPTKIKAAYALNGLWDAISKAAWLEAREAANHPEGRVFAPPPATFSKDWHAREIDLQECPVLVWDLDSHPVESLARLRQILGEPTLIIASGGEWTDPSTGELQTKVHTYYRLTEPASCAESAKLAKNIRKGISGILNSDGSADSLVHPMRMAGSWHTKRAPVMCRIIGGDHRRELDLRGAARRVLALLPPKPQATTSTPRYDTNDTSVKAWGRSLVDVVCGATQGLDTNKRLYWSLRRVGEKLSIREIDPAEASALADAICEAAASVGHSRNRIISTRRSALRGV
jgi:hypothetical protein